MAKSFHLSIAHVAETVFDGEALSVTLPGEGGELTVLAGHEALVTPLRAGTIHYETASGEKGQVAIERGILEVSGTEATVLL